MCNFTRLTAEQQNALHKELSSFADAIGGTNFFLGMLEEIRKAHPHALLAKHAAFEFRRGTIQWKKVIFKDKLSLLSATMNARTEERPNLLPDSDAKEFKKVLNMLRALAPLRFDVIPKNLKTGEGFSFSPFELVDEQTTLINPVFEAIFFCPVSFTKKALTHKVIDGTD